MRKEVTLSLVPKRDKDENIVDEMVIRVQHLMAFDLNNANERLFFEVVKDDEMIAESKSKVNPDYHRFYIEDKEREAAATITKSKLKRKAFEVIDELSSDQRENYARVLGKWVAGLSGSQVESALYDVAEETPQLVLDVNNDKDLKHKIFLRRLVEAYILHMDNGKYMNGKDLVGINEDYAIHWLKDPNNSSLISQWGRMLEQGKAYQPRIEEISRPSSDAGDFIETETFENGRHEDSVVDPGQVDNNENEEPTE